MQTVRKRPEYTAETPQNRLLAPLALDTSRSSSGSSRPAAAAAPLVLGLVGLVVLLGNPLFRLILRIVIILRVGVAFAPVDLARIIILVVVVVSSQLLLAIVVLRRIPTPTACTPPAQQIP